VFLAFVLSCQKNATSISLRVSIPFGFFAPLRALRETKKLCVFEPLCLRVKKMLQAFLFMFQFLLRSLLLCALCVKQKNFVSLRLRVFVSLSLCASYVCFLLKISSLRFNFTTNILIK
jgi:hypothetical protein